MTVEVNAGRVPQWTMQDRLRKARESAEMTQTELAEAIGIARNTVGRFETGVQQIRRPLVLAWALATGVPADWLLTGEAPLPGGNGASGEECARRDSNPQPSDP